MLYKLCIFCKYVVYILVYFAKFANSNPPRANPPFLPIRTYTLVRKLTSDFYVFDIFNVFGVNHVSNGFNVFNPLDLLDTLDLLYIQGTYFL